MEARRGKQRKRGCRREGEDSQREGGRAVQPPFIESFFFLSLGSPTSHVPAGQGGMEVPVPKRGAAGQHLRNVF